MDLQINQNCAIRYIGNLQKYSRYPKWNQKKKEKGF